MPDGLIGSVGVGVVPNADNFWKEFVAKTEPGATGAGQAAGQQWSRGFESGVKVDPLKRTNPQQKEKSKRDGAAAGDAYGRSFAQHITAAVNSLPDPDIKPDVDLTGADLKLAKLRDELAEFIDPKLKPDVTDREALDRLRVLQGRLNKLTDPSHDIRIRVNAKAAAAELAGLQAQIDKTEKKSAAGAGKTDDKKQSAGLLKAVLPLAPAIVPIAGAAAAAGAALAAMGATAILAFKGAQAAIKAGTADGQHFAAGVGTMKSALATLEATAAHGVLGGFEQSIQSVTTQLPMLGTQTAAISQQLGEIGAHVVGGIAGGLSSFGPLIQQVLGYVNQLTGKFEGWATGPGGAHFAQTLSKDFGQVVPVLTNLAVAATHLAEAFASSGSSEIDLLSTFSGVIAHIPVGIITAATDAYIAFQVAVRVTAGLTAARTALIGFAEAEGAAATGAVAMARTTAGGLGAVIGRLSPYIAGVVVADLAITHLTSKQNSWTQSNDKLKRAVGDVGTELHQFATFHWGDFLSGQSVKANEGARHLTNSINATSAAFEKARAASQANGGSAYTNVERYAGANLAALQRSATLVRDALAGQSVNLDSAGASLTNYSKNLAASTSAEQKWLTQGKDTGAVINGVAVYTDTWSKALAASGGNADKAAALIASHADALRDDQAAAVEAARESARLNDAVGAAAAKYHLTAGQITTYSAALGVTAQQVATGRVSTKQFADAIGLVRTAFANGNVALQGWLTDLGKIDMSSNTLTTRVSLLGAGLKALQGVTLDMAGANLQAASSSEDAANAIAQHKHVFGDQGQLLGQLTKTTHGYVIEQPKLTKNALLVEQAMSSAGQSAITLAQNIYQNTGSAKKAGDAYYGLRQQFIGTLEQMGYMPGKAKKIADSIYGIPGKKFVSFLQKGDLPGAIRNLSSSLGNFTKQFGKILVALGINVPKKSKTDLANVITSLSSINGKTFTASVQINTPNPKNIAGPIYGGAKADGGRINVGTGPRADDVLIRASRGEYVVNAQQTAKHYNLIESINKGTAGFADGGLIDPSLITDAVGKQKKTVHFDLSLLASFVGTAVNAQANPLVDALNSIFDSARAAHQTLSAGFVADLRGQNRQLIAATNERDRVATQLQNAQQKLADLRSSYKQEVATVSSAYQGTLNVAQVTTKYNEPVTIGTILRQARQAARDARSFTSILAKLRREGLSSALIQQLAEAGPAAIAEARALASATPKQILALNASEATIQRQGSKGGHTAAEDMYRAGIDAANGLVQGLKSRESALRSAVRDLAQQMVSEIKATLGIHSPSRVGMELGGHFGQGVALGVAGKHGAVTAQANRLAQALASGGGNQAASSFSGGAGGAFSFTQHNYHPVTVASGPSGPDAMRAAVNLLGRR